MAPTLLHEIWGFSLLVLYLSRHKPVNKMHLLCAKLCLRKPRCNSVLPSKALFHLWDWSTAVLRQPRIPKDTACDYRWAKVGICIFPTLPTLHCFPDHIPSFRNKEVVLCSNCSLKAISKHNLFHCLTWKINMPLPGDCSIAKDKQNGPIISANSPVKTIPYWSNTHSQATEVCFFWHINNA